MNPRTDTQQIQPNVGVKRATSKKTLLILGVFVVFMTVGAYILGVQTSMPRPAQVAITSTPSPLQPTPNLSAMADWVSYKNSQINFSLSYPKYWILDELKDNGVVDGFELKGSEGTVRAAWGSGFGGGCDDQYHENFTIFGRSRDICHVIKADGTENWNQIYEDLGSKGTFGVYATANSPYLKNRDVILQILSTFKFTDAGEPATSSSDTSIRTIAYKKTAGLADYASNTGYSIQIPTGFQAGESEKMSGSSCVKYFNNGAGGITTATIVPYNGGSRRVLLPEEASYTYTYEDVMFQGIKSLIQQKGPNGESGSGTNVIIPIGKYALIVGMANRGKDDDQFVSLLQSIKFINPLDLRKCGK